MARRTFTGACIGLQSLLRPCSLDSANRYGVEQKRKRRRCIFELHGLFSNRCASITRSLQSTAEAEPYTYTMYFRNSFDCFAKRTFEHCNLLM